jgi:hypothetical protein
MIYLKDYSQYTLCKDIFLTFTKQFAKKPLNDIDFIIQQKLLITNDPILTHYAYQYALNIVYEKK